MEQPFFMKLKLYIFIAMKRFINIILLVLVLGIIFVPGVKVFIQSSLMRVGFFKPNLKEASTEATTTSYALTFRDEKGTSYNLEDLKGKVVFINFWATWCPPCIAEMPTIQSLYENFRNDENVKFVMLEVDGNEKKAAELFNKKGLSLPISFPNGNIPPALFKGTLPTTVILDKNGKIVFHTEGITNYSDQKMVDFIRKQK
ncbi:TlpA family protein disulfide reductase [Elizabethkingia meningoseptica]|uniref:TlpA family protein disulfide reductase n=1 Tax=Elizabethkingia meningoseptica TaxID=238 RepID=UPI0023AE7868|nr:TlpA disulfide reductase family protein [Elizabethkingia meningoseptica]MDE5525950.1 TlpA family protein disulfide reductase [Elizabethkingia meningoseptica]